MQIITHPVPLTRAQQFANHLGIRLPIFLAPMAGACPPSLSAGVANAGGLGACGALLLDPESISTWARDFRTLSHGVFQLNLWIPGPTPLRDLELENRQREFLAQWGPAVSPDAALTKPPDFEAQCQAMLNASPKVISSIMGVYPPHFVRQMKSQNILWFATVTTVEEALIAERAGADAIVAQGMEAGGHRGAFQADQAENQMVGLMALVPQVVDAVRVPVIATGGIADGRQIAAAIMLGASAVQLGTAFLRTPEANIPAPYAERLSQTEAHQTITTRAFSGRTGRAIANQFVLAAASGPSPAPYPIQRGLTAGLRASALQAGNIERMQAWAGQSAKMASSDTAAHIVHRLWEDAVSLLTVNTLDCASH